MLRQLRSAIGVMRNFLRDAQSARAQSGRPLAIQFAEALLLRLPPGKLGINEYYDYRLYRSELSFSDKRRFIGWRGEPDLDRGNDARWHPYADDKVMLDALLASACLPRPRLQSVYRSPSEPGPATERLNHPEALADWLRLRAQYPVFVKPSHAGFGRGTHLIQAHRRNDDNLIMDDGSTATVDAFVQSLPNPGKRGTLFQSLLRPHAALAALNGGRLSTLRMMTLIESGQEPTLYRAVWKVPRRFNIIDNFERGTTGNLLGQIDRRSGAVRRVVEGYGIGLRELTHHPDSGLPFGGLRLPDWADAVAVTLAAARLMPEFRFQHWDIALTDRGPVPLEVNLFAAGGTELSQLADGVGLLEPKLLVVNRLK